MSSPEASAAATVAPHALGGVKHIIMVLSGKGGVGKSTVACQLALSLTHQHHMRVGLLDVDICGPSVAKICGLEDKDVFRDALGWKPVALVPTAPTSSGEKEGGLPSSTPGGSGVGELKVMSIAYLLPSDRDAVVWRGPKKDAMIKQFINEVNWGPLDYLIVDTPPGTSDEHLTLCEVLKAYNPTGAVIVTTPQDVATDDVKKELSFCYKLGVRCLGIVENMSGFVCPHCAHCTDIFSKGGGRKLAEMYEVAFLGAVPIDPNLSIAEDRGQAFLGSGDEKAVGQTAEAVNSVITSILKEVERADAAAA